MASPQLENGYTPISNELLEAILRTPRLSARELKCLLAVARETYGWRRKARPVPTNRIATLTGLTWVKAARALRRLTERNILVNGSGGLGLQKDYHAWVLPLPPSETDRPKWTVRNGPSEMDGQTPSETDRSTQSEMDGYKTRKQESNPSPTVPTAKDRPLDGFEEFWRAYPKKKAKGEAERAWRKVPPGIRPAVMASVRRHAESDPSWRRDGGQFIPYPATFLNGRQWEDELPEDKPEWAGINL